MQQVNWGQSFGTLVDQFGGRPAVCTTEGRHDFAEVFGRAAAVAAALRERGVVAGEPVATLLPNAAHAVWAGFGVVLAGAAEASLNAGLTADELRYALGVLAARHVIADRSTAAAVRAAGTEPMLVEELAAEVAPIDRAAPVSGEAWGKILFTSGTTGRPKAIVHSQSGRWLANLMLRASLPFRPEPGSRILLMTPYSHGASLLTGAFLDHGASIHLMTGVEPERVRALLDAGEVDCMFAPPTVLAKLVGSFEGRTWPHLRAIFSGTSTLLPSVYRRVREMFGPVVRITYGKTEIFNPITVLPPVACEASFAADDAARGANLGWPASGVEIEIRDEEGGRLPAETPGRIFIRAPHMMTGYVDGDGFHAVDPASWHESGDIGFLSARGELFLAGRDHEMIKTGGFKIFPHEVEAALQAGAGAREIVAVGLPSEYWGQIVVAVAEQGDAGWEARAESAVSALSRHKRPRAFLSLPALPRNAQGKLQRSRLVELVLQHYRVEDGPHPTFQPIR